VSPTSLEYLRRKILMSFIVDALVGKQIDAVLVDSELMYVMLSNGTQITVKGLVIVEPAQARPTSCKALAIRKPRTRSKQRP
jgi:hypothetical protein